VFPLQHDEWVVCRVFQKMAGNKKMYMCADVPYTDSLPQQQQQQQHHRDSSPNPTVTDDGGDCDTCTGGNESCYACLDQQAPPWMADSKALAMAMDAYYPGNMMGAQRGYLPMQPSSSRAARATKAEPAFFSEDEAQSSQRLNLDYTDAWGGENFDALIFQSQSTSDGAVVFCDDAQPRMLPRSFRGSFPDMTGPLEELGWAY
jgi:hypothetical protein